MPCPRTLLAAAAMLAIRAAGAIAQPAGLPAYDFTQPDVVEQWRPTHDISRLESTPEGMRIDISGGDPYTIGPAASYPVGQPLWLHVRLFSEAGGTGQIFYFTVNPAEENSVHFPVKAGEWVDVKVPMVSLGPGYHLRLDPPGANGSCIVASIRFSPRTLLKEPAWPKPTVPKLGRDAITVEDGDVTLRHSRTQVGAFEVLVDGKRMAVGNTRPLVGYLYNGKLRWMDLARAGHIVNSIGGGRGALLTLSATDPDGGKWTIAMLLGSLNKITHDAMPLPQGRTGVVPVSITVRVDRDRDVVYLPLTTLFAGGGATGSLRSHGLFAGLEYLDKPDRSSSEDDIKGPGARRQVPDNEKVTIPLMAIQNDGRYVGLAWEADPRVSAVFDSPDRLFHSGGHAMGLTFPGSNGSNREEGHLLPYGGERLAPGKPFTAKAEILGGKGDSVVPAVRQYVALHGLPPVPAIGETRQAYYAQAAHGWLDSKVRIGDRFRHAYWPGISGFGPTPAADAALFMEWLAHETTDKALATRLTQRAQATIAQVPPAMRHAAGVSHVRYVAPALANCSTREAVQSAASDARSILTRFQPDGTILYRQRPGELDYGRTHFAKHANGLTAPEVDTLLTDAALSGNQQLIDEALKKLAGLDRYMNEAPRGAQTWEVPLHTPDILASAHLLSAYLTGYELTGRKELLDKALYWAWTGVPFVYLVQPSRERIGLYGTIPVFGATQWVGSWFGLPVQWCGLVYADGLYRLTRYDSGGPWKKLADGITASGIQQSWPASDPDLGGLFPDSFVPGSQTRNPVAINPGGVQACAIRLLGGPRIYDFRCLRSSGITVHAPAEITVLKDGKQKAIVVVQGWLPRPYEVLIGRLEPTAKVTVDGKPLALNAETGYDADRRQLILRVEGKPKVEIGW